MNIEYQTFCHNAVIKAPEYVQEELKERFSKINLFPQYKQRCEDLNMIDENYLVTEKNKGAVPFLLYLTRIKSETLSILIDITNINEPLVYLLNLRFDVNLYRDFGTLFHSELVYNDKECWILLITDILFNSGRCITHFNLTNKLKTISDILKKSYVRDDFMNPFYIQIKNFYTFNHITAITNSTTLLFYPENPKNYILEVDMEVKETEDEKYEEMEYKLVNVKELPDVYKIYMNDNFIDILSVYTLSDSKILNELFNESDELMVKCRYDIITKEWYAVL